MSERVVACQPGDPDIARILALPRHVDADEGFVEALSRYLSRPGSECMLRQKQAEFARALYELGGCFASMPTGEGKTLATLFAPTLVQAERPVLLLPASDRDKLRTEFAEYLADGWNVRLPTLLSYSEMTLESREQRLWELAPDLVMLDEADVARNLTRALGRRLRRYIEGARAAGRTVRVAVLSGTLITDALLDYWEFLVWALQARAPVPLDRDGAERWAGALDQTLTGEMYRNEPGELERLPGGFHAWLRGTAGVVSGRGEVCDSAIEIRMWRPPIPPTLQRVIDTTTATRRRPDGEPLSQWDLPDCLCHLAQGFYLIWDPLPPSWWLDPRRAWCEYERAVLDAQLEGFDTALQIVNALDAGRPVPGGDGGRRLLAAWRAVKDRFEPNTVPVWLDESIMDAAAEHARAHPGTVVWVKNIEPGLALARRGLPYYGADTRPDKHVGGGSFAAGMSHARGKNMQHVSHRSLFLHPMAKARRWEQAIARQHRPGQREPIVYVDIMCTLPYHGEVLERVAKQARADSDASGVEHKMIVARWL